jgi:hypothetical protein
MNRPRVNRTTVCSFQRLSHHDDLVGHAFRGELCNVAPSEQEDMGVGVDSLYLLKSVVAGVTKGTVCPDAEPLWRY